MATSTSVTVGSVSTTILASNGARIEAIITNDSNQDIYLKYGTGASSGGGILLKSGGAFIIENIYTGIITGICASGGKNLTVIEL